MEAALVHADRRTDMTKLTGTFRDYAKAPEKLTSLLCINKSRQRGVLAEQLE